MTDEEIEATRVFFGYNNKACEILVVDKYFEKLESDFVWNIIINIASQRFPDAGHASGFPH